MKVVNLTKGEVADFLLEEGMLKHYPFLLDVVSGTQRLLGVFGLPFCLFNPSHTQKGEKKGTKKYTTSFKVNGTSTSRLPLGQVRKHHTFQQNNPYLTNLTPLGPFENHILSLKFLLRLHRWKISVNESMACCSFPVASRPYCSFFGSDQLEPYWQ